MQHGLAERWAMWRCNDAGRAGVGGLVYVAVLLVWAVLYGTAWLEGPTWLARYGPAIVFAMAAMEEFELRQLARVFRRQPRQDCRAGALTGLAPLP